MHPEAPPGSSRLNHKWNLNSTTNLRYEGHWIQTPISGANIFVIMLFAFLCYSVLSSAASKAISVQATNISASSSCDDSRDCRTVWSIALSCIVTIIAWAWITVRPNIPYPVDKRGMRVWKRLLYTGRVFSERFSLFALGIICPEYILSFASNQRFAARDAAEGTGKSTVINIMVTILTNMTISKA